MSTQTINLDSITSSSSKRIHKRKPKKEIKIFEEENKIITSSDKNTFSRESYFSISDTHKFRSMVVPVSKMPDPLPFFTIKLRQLGNQGTMIYFQWPILTGKLGIETDYVYLSQSISGSPNLEISSSLVLYINNMASLGSVIVNPFAEQSVRFYLTQDRTKLPAETEFIIPGGVINYYSA